MNWAITSYHISGFQDEIAKPSDRVKDRSAGRKDEAEDYVDATLSGKILKQARLQVQELEDDVETSGGQKKKLIQKKTVQLGPSGGGDDDSDDDDEEVEEGTGKEDLDGKGFMEEVDIEVTERDEAAFAEFMNR